MKTVIIEDEELAIKGLKNLLANYPDFFEVVAIARNGDEAIEIVERIKPDLIFLDIEMPVFNGFEVLKKLRTMPLIVFTTAYDAFAVKAFEENSVDYLLKPIEKQRFDLTVIRLKQKKSEQQTQFNFQKFANLLSSIGNKKEIHSLTVKAGEKMLFISITEIAYFFAEERYVFLNTLDGKQYLTNYTIQNLEDILPKEFVRISRSTIINSKHILEAQRFFTGNYIITLKDVKKSKIETGRKYVENFFRLFDY
ncbi:LytTR family DNA-binding domain-containing protein [Emticicia sp. BO119]|uniref:LytR/AlgR family response regulator transcription factor n=1 Tax=Emticicia sp. BO119 TaxID=2757768 RepID=UPI0015F0756C|nr:LytTR family DNA-binding domain-containing protein [Emticicia sp. BO119]MBA4850869.1 response regulator transcription factor [Emticicia sp. BO119]